MTDTQHVRFLLREMTRWKESGLIDPATFERLVKEYSPDTSPAGMQGAAPVDDQAAPLYAELEARAEELVAGDQPEPTLEESLAKEVAFHQEVEALVVQERSLQHGARATPVSTLDDAAAPTVEQRIVERDSVWSRHIQPFLYDNALWLAGGLLVLFGSLYLLRAIWDELASLPLHAVVAVAFHLYALGFFGLGQMLSRRRQAYAVGRILFCFSVALMPLASVATGELAWLLVRHWGSAGAALALLAALGSLVAVGGMLSVIAGLYQRASIRPLVRTGLALASLTIAVAPLEHLLGLNRMLLFGAVAGFGVLAHGLVSLGRERVNERTSILLFGGSTLWAFAVLVGRVQLAVAIPLVHYTPLLGAVGALLVYCDRTLRLHAGHEARLTGFGIAFHGAVLAAIGTAIFGLVQLGYFDVWARCTVLVASAIAVVVFAVGARRHGRHVMTHVAATCGLFTFFFLPAPFTGLILLVTTRVHSALGYVNEPLPVAFYGLTFLPYLAGTLALAVALRRRNPKQHDKSIGLDLERFTATLSGLVVVLAATSFTDLRPMLWTWPLYALGAFAVARLLERPPLRYAGQVLALASLVVLGKWTLLTWGLPTTEVLLGSYALLNGLLLLRRRSHPGHHGLAAVGGAALAVLFLLSPGSTAAFGYVATTLLLASGTFGLVAATYRGPVLAYLAAASLFAATALLSIELSPPGSWHPIGTQASALVFFGLAAIGAVLAHLFRTEPDADDRSRLITHPAALTGALAGATALLLAFPTLPVLGPLLAVALFVHLAWAVRAKAMTFAAGPAVALSVGMLAHHLLPAAWPPVLAGLACGYLLFARAARRRWPNEAGPRAKALELVSYLCATVGILGAAHYAVMGSRWWALLTAVEVGCFGASIVLVDRRQSAYGTAALTAVVGSTVAAGWVLLASTSSLPARVDPTWLFSVLLVALSALWLGLSHLLGRENLKRTARWSASALLLGAVAPVVLSDLLATLRCGHAWGWQYYALDASSFFDIGPIGAVTAGVCTLVAVFIHRTTSSGAFRTAAGHLLLLAATAAAIFVTHMSWPGAHLTPVSVLLAIALAALRRVPKMSWLSIPFGWPLALGTLALVASHFHLRTWQPALALAGMAAVFALHENALQRKGIAYGWAIHLVLALQATMFWVAALISTGRHPTGAVAALLAPMALATAMALAWVGRKIEAREVAAAVTRVSRCGLVAVGPLAILAVILCHPQNPAVVLVVLAFLTGRYVQLAARHDGKRWMVAAALVALTAIYGVVRTVTPLSGPWPQLDGTAIVLASTLALWTTRATRTRWQGVSHQPLAAAAVLWPLCALPLLIPHGSGLTASGGALLALVVAVHYVAAARILRIRHLVTMGLLFGNGALILTWSTLRWASPLLYIVPVALTLLTMIHLYERSLSARSRTTLRSIVLLGLYGSCVAITLGSLSAVQALVVVPSLCVFGIIVGTLLRIRVYLMASIGFLVADLGLNMLRFGFASRALGALFLTVLGLVIVGAMVVFTLERERILRRYSTVLNELRAWE